MHKVVPIQAPKGDKSSRQGIFPLGRCWRSLTATLCGGGSSFHCLFKTDICRCPPLQRCRFGNVLIIEKQMEEGVCIQWCRRYFRTLSQGPAHTVFAVTAGWALWGVGRRAGKLNSNLCKVLIRTQTIPIRELERHLHSSRRLPMASAARLVCLGSIFWNPAPERLSHMTELFASLCCWIPREVFTMCCKKKGLSK